MNGNALGYLLRTKLHNQIIGFFKKPVRIVFIVLFIGIIAVTLVGGKSGAEETDRVLRDISELTAGLNALLILIFSTTFYSGLNSGGMFFKMADVNFLFPSPLNKRNILFYALIQQIGTSMLIGLFILFQYTMLHVSYNLSFFGLLLIFLSYSLTVFFSQTAAMFLYTFISDSDKKKAAAKTALFAVIFALLAYIGLHVLQNKTDIVKALAAAGNGLPVLLFPFAGWMGGFAGNILKGNYILSALWLTLSVVGFLVMLAAMSKSKREYYEDVLASTETMQSALFAAKEGVAPEAAPRVIKVGKSGIGKGKGSSVFFYKHLLENRRASKFFLSPMSIVFIFSTIGFSFFLKSSGILPSFFFSIYMMIFSVALGRFNRELTKPYIYLIPEPSLNKMIYSLAESLPTQLFESALTLIPVSIIVDASVAECIMCIAARVSFAALFLSSSVLIDRIWGGSMPKIAGMFVFLLVDVILAIPGAALSIVLISFGIVPISEVFTMTICITVCNLPVAALVLYLCRNMLQYAEV